MSFTSPLSILYEDAFFIAVNKPVGILVHRTRISEDQQFVLQILRDQIKQRVYPVHRLDRGTSGVLLFGKTKEAASEFSTLIRNKQIKKHYLGIIRGYVLANETIDYPLAKEKHLPKQNAITHYTKIAETTLDIAVNRYPTSRYSLVKIELETGRWHQIRRHFSHIRHPIIGDKKHGDVKHNKYWNSHFEIKRMLLHAESLQFVHPFFEKEIKIQAMFDTEFEQALKLLGFDYSFKINT